MDSFQKEQKQFRCDFSHTNKLFYSGDNYSSMTNQLDVFNQMVHLISYLPILLGIH